MKRMKRILCVIMAAALLLTTLSASVFAVDTVQINFTVPEVGDTMHKHGNHLTANDGVTCTVQAVYTGDEVTTIVSDNIAENTSQVKKYVESTESPSENYLNNSYLIILRLEAESGTFSSSPKITTITTVPVTSNKLNTGDADGSTMYAYLLFTPTTNSGSGDGDSGSSGDESNNAASTYSNDVRVSYMAEETQEIVSVKVKWGEMKFTYSPVAKGTWNPAKHEYENRQEAKWSCSGNDITVTSHSNVPLTATLKYTYADGFDGITGKFVNTQNAEFTNNTMDIPTAEGTEVGNPPTVTAYLILDGVLDKNTDNDSVSGTVTITID